MTGRDRLVPTINGSVPGPVLRWREGEDVTIRVTNRLDEPTSIHWHGIILPANMDGVPGISFGGIAPGATFTYRFPVKQSGTYWYHSHSELQEQAGMYAPIIIEPAHREPYRYDREYMVMLADWTDEDPHTVFAKLKKQSGYYNFNKRTASDFFRDVAEKGWGATISIGSNGAACGWIPRTSPMSQAISTRFSSTENHLRPTGPHSLRRASACGCGLSTAR